ncbi:Coenzyme F420 hydrogenase/dehydrogenase, beta subunit C-terminal domain [Candidatus Bathyarchaeota archaeon]|nr:Coenzyme F420 hydrogenase/dehydrogenase, beta subunit C-terminal domain [Candidatus Bathyarchaeota archaeon]
MEAKEVTLKIDGKDVKATEGASILEVARKVGIEIPTLCYSSALEPFGSCRVCSVEITDARGRKKVVTSCNYPVKEGLEVSTKSEKVLKTRKLLLELLLARCPKVKKIQDLAREYGVEKPRFWIEDVEEDCILCGLCTRVCGERIGVYAINFANRGVEREVTAPYHSFSDDCIGCGACAIVCPTNSRRIQVNTYPTLPEDIENIEQKFLKGTKDENFGVYSDVFAAKSSVDGQDGGVATALLVSGMQRGLFDSAIVVQRTEGYNSEAVIAENVDNIMKAKGTKYLRVKMMSKLGELIDKGKKKIAVVGTACEVRAARKIQKILLKEFPDVEITIIGLFCFEAFDYEKLKKETKKLLGVDLDKAEKTQIHKGQYIVQIDGKEYACKVKELNDAIEKGCAYCDDFTAKLADISVGSVGSPDGYSTVIVRSDVGKRLLEKLDLAKEDANTEEVTKLSIFKKKRATKNFAPILQDMQIQTEPQTEQC